MDEKFKPAWWLSSKHAQTIWGRLFRKPPTLPLRRERVDLPDGDFIDLDWYDQASPHVPTVLLLHGVAGSINSHYARGLLKSFHDQGWRAVFMHFRGCSEESNRFKQGYHCADTADLDHIVNHIIQVEKPQKLATVAVSMGGVMLLHWLNKTGKNNPLSAAATISTPFNVESGLVFARKNMMGRVYENALVKGMKRYATRKMHHFSDLFHPSTLKKIKTFQDYDNLVTAPVHGFKDANEYYKKISLKNNLKNIAVPTLILHAKDDPLTSPDSFPRPEELSPSITFELQEKGGHAGFIGSASLLKLDFWLERRIPAFLKKYLA